MSNQKSELRKIISQLKKDKVDLVLERNELNRQLKLVKVQTHLLATEFHKLKTDIKALVK